MFNGVNVRYMRRVRMVAVVLLLVIPGMLAAQWEADYRLTTDSDTSSTSFNNAWCIAAREDTLHVVWHDNRDGNYEIYYKRSCDGGTTWGPDTRLTNEPNLSLYPSVAVAGPDVHVVWEDERDQAAEVYHKCSTDGGVTWGPDVLVTAVSGTQGMPSVAVVAGCVHTAWVDFSLMGNSEVYFCRSVDGGTTWDTPVQISYATGFSTSPSIAASGSNVHIAWHDSRYGWWNNEIFYRMSTDDGVDWGSETQLTDDSTFSNSPSIAATGNDVHVAWQDMRDGNFEIYYNNSTDNGQIWSSDLRLTNDGADSYYPSVVASGSNVHIVWQDSRDGNDEIYYKISNNGGLNWDPDLRLTNDQSISQSASITVAGQGVHIVWTDERDGNPEIYYKRNPTGNTGIAEFTDDVASGAYLFAAPNPFSKLMKVSFGIEHGAERTALNIYDAIGRLVKSYNFESCIMDHALEISWDGTDQADQPLSSGVYFVKLNAGDFTATEKLLLLR
jgi:hypothetical protein